MQVMMSDNKAHAGYLLFPKIHELMSSPNFILLARKKIVIFQILFYSSFIVFFLLFQTLFIPLATHCGYISSWIFGKSKYPACALLSDIITCMF
jgi:hypothetical protein